jgi:hypothetical protein
MYRYIYRYISASSALPELPEDLLAETCIQNITVITGGEIEKMPGRNHAIAGKISFCTSHIASINAGNAGPRDISP